MTEEADARPSVEAEPVSEEDAEAYVASVCFRAGPPGAVGIEAERLVHARTDAGRPVTVPDLRAVLAPLGNRLPGGGALSFEPGGQVEVSSACANHPRDLLPDVRADLAAVDRLLEEAGLAPGPLALDPLRPPRRSLDLPRYAAMQRHFDAAGPSGRTMMCSTASLQVCLEAGPDPQQARKRWERAHRLLPVLVAMFANSPFQHGRSTGWKSTRQRVWSRIEAARTEAVPARHPGVDPAEAWARYALDAPLLCLPADDGGWDAPPGLTLRAWLQTRRPRPATRADVAYHLTTLFPPVRPRGFLELRAFDAQAGADWEAAAVVVWALMDDAGAAAAADAACGRLGPKAPTLDDAARLGLDHPALAAMAEECAGAVLDALPRWGLDATGQRRVKAFAEAYPLRGRCPADARLEHWRRTGELYPGHSARTAEDPECEEGS
ncbi:glutamate-cysteine ligase family protein [Arthrobacter sp. I2-34]|uniref:Glutamate--cysteine ligase EgtA n=1 Tax=Arthrobacter hankyongi TaxID=2904801 RepID=A0ABS9LAH7_9MICC|nr:glutamate-cysteine ligase family protein [Arthrobacter hankyongi]MCG2623670.1 glutamate-cysteine ligase family protein [Arthrobacter hankyongi]